MLSAYSSRSMRSFTPDPATAASGTRSLSVRHYVFNNATFKCLRSLGGGNGDRCRDPFKDNIGEVSLRPGLAYEPIDVVYTWVNGSDPIWVEKMQFWKEKMLEKEHSEAISANASVGNEAVNATSGEGDQHSLNRYRDSNELKYSLRSLELYAPWIHKIYIVTDNQVPNWLDTTHPRIQMISHTDIFNNVSHLPVFSSPAIEAHLHNIPGLTKKFIYFNDDVMLGRSVLPEDFTSVSGVQKFVFAWEVPKCAPGCSDSWIGDGYCDRACNVSSCDFDFPDCVNATVAVGRNTRHDGQKAHTAMCAKGCPETWVSDKTCDNKCKNEACGWDIGDCGLEIMAENMPHIALTLKDVSFSMSNSGGISNSTMHDNTDSDATELFTNDIVKGGDIELPEKAVPLVMTIVNGTTSVYFNLSFLPCQARHDISMPCKQNFSYTAARYIASEGIVHQSILLNKHDILGVLLFHGQEGAPDHPGFPQDVEFIVSGANVVTDISVEVKFRIRLVKNDQESEMKVAYEGIPTGLHPLDGRCAACPETAEMEDFVYAHGNPVLKSKLHTQPFLSNENPLQGLTQSSSINSIYVGAVVQMTLNPHILNRLQSIPGVLSSVQIGDEKLGNIFVRQVITSHNMRMMQTVVPICTVLGRFNAVTADWFGALYPFSSKERDECYRLTLRQFLSSESNKNSLQRIKSKPKYPNIRFSSEITENNNNKSAENIDNTMLLLLHFPKNFTERNLPSSAEVEEKRLNNNNNSSNLLHNDLQRWFQIRVELFRIDEAMNEKSANEIEFSTTVLSLMQVNEPKPIHVQNSVKFAENSARFGCMLLNVKWQFDPIQEEIYELSDVFTEPNHSLSELSIKRRLTDVRGEKVVRDIKLIYSVGSKVSTEVKNKHVSRPLGSNLMVNKMMSSSSKYKHDLSNQSVLSKERMHSVLMSYLSAGLIALVDRSKLEQKTTAKFGHSLIVVEKISGAMVEFWRLIATSLGFTAVEDISLNRRRLTTDTYGQSLIYVNRLYHKTFGAENRKVPAHVPHMIDSVVMKEMQDMFKEEWLATSSHKFRSSKDMQYAFSYYYYLMNRNKAKPPSLYEYVSTEVDTNHDGFLDENEFLTLSSLVAGRSPKQSEIDKYYECTYRLGNYSNLTHTYNESSVSILNSKEKSDDEKLIRKKIGAAAIRKIEKIVQDRKDAGVESNPEGTVSITSVSKVELPGVTYEHSIKTKRFPSVDDVLGCPMIVSELKDRLSWPITYTTGTEKDVAFEMIGDNFTDSYSQLNSIRARRPKFICINDNMKEPSIDLMKAFADFFSAMYPLPSSFELTLGTVNPSLYTDELLAMKQSTLLRIISGCKNLMSHILSPIISIKFIVVSFLKMIVMIIDGDDEGSGLYLFFRRVFVAKGSMQSSMRSMSFFSGWVTSHDHGYEMNAAGKMIHTMSMSLPFSFLVVNCIVVSLILWIYRSTRRRRVLPQTSVAVISSDSNTTMQPALDEVAKLDGVTAPKLAVAASVEKSKSSRMTARPSKEDNEDFLNKLWRTAGYSGGETEEKSPADNSDNAEPSWEDREQFLGEGKDASH